MSQFLEQVRSALLSAGLRGAFYARRHDAGGVLVTLRQRDQAKTVAAALQKAGLVAVKVSDGEALVTQHGHQ